MSELRLINAIENNAIYMTTEYSIIKMIMKQFQYSCSLFCKVAHTKFIKILDAVNTSILCLDVTIVRYSVYADISKCLVVPHFT